MINIYVTINIYSFIYIYLCIHSRFSEISGKLNHDKFRQSYDFLEEYQENEIKTMESSLKKMSKLPQDKRTEVIDHLKNELIK